MPGTNRRASRLQPTPNSMKQTHLMQEVTGSGHRRLTISSTRPALTRYQRGRRGVILSAGKWWPQSGGSSLAGLGCIFVQPVLPVSRPASAPRERWRTRQAVDWTAWLCACFVRASVAPKDSRKQLLRGVKLTCNTLQHPSQHTPLALQFLHRQRATQAAVLHQRGTGIF